jgi:predicted dehydrogenase
MISEFHLRAWRRTAGATVVAICDPDIARAAARAGEFGIERVYRDFERMLAEQELDALDIATPLETHEALVRIAAVHGVDAMCQKPLAPTLDAARRLADETQGRIRLMVHENWRFRASYRLVRRWIAEGRLGRIQQCFMVAHSSGLVADAAGARPALRREPSLATSRHLTIGTLLVHHLDVLRCLLGDLSLVAVRAGRMAEEVVAETYATLLLESEAGAPVVLSGNMAAPGRPTYIADALTIIGTEASVVFRDGRLDLSGPQAGESHGFDQPDLYQSAFDACVDHFVGCLRSGAPFETDARDNLRTLSLAYEAMGLAEKQLRSAPGAGTR